MLEAIFASRAANEWFKLLDAHGVPCEISSETWGGSWFDDADVIAKGWVADYHHPVWGRLQQPGAFFAFSDTPARIAGPPPMIGGHTEEILKELDYDIDEIQQLRDDGAVAW